MRPADGPPISLPRPRSTSNGARQVSDTTIPSRAPLAPLGGVVSLTSTTVGFFSRTTDTVAVVPGDNARSTPVSFAVESTDLPFKVRSSSPGRSRLCDGPFGSTDDHPEARRIAEFAERGGCRAVL